jgi:outer membrane lipoprotein-sorting protein
MKVAILDRSIRCWRQGLYVFLFLPLGLTACASLRPASLPPSLAVSSLSLPLAQDLLNSIETRRQAMTSLRGLARVVYKDTQEKGTAKQAIAVAAPDRFRWELFSPIGVAALVTSNGQMLSTYFPSEKVLYRGGATAVNVARFTRVALSPREIVGLLLGTPVLPPMGESCTVDLDTTQDWHRLSCHIRAEGGVTLWFEPQTLRLRRMEVATPDGTALKRMDLADYRTVGNQTFPFEVTLSDFQSQQQASILYERVELNTHPADSIFTLASINGVREVDADAFTH